MNENNWERVKSIAATLGILLTVFVGIKIVSEFKAMKYIGGGNMANTITVSGKGEVLSTPDVATFNFGVTEEGASVPEAQKKAVEKMSAILAYIKTSGISDKDVKTVSYNIYPRYEYRSSTGVYYPSGKQVLAAYVVSQTIEVKVRKLEDAGKVLSNIGEYGATDVSGLSFSVDAVDTVAREARDKAIVDARDQAIKLAKSLGVSLGQITSFSENNSGYPQPIYYKTMNASAEMGMGGDASAQELPTGQNKITSSVTITYEIK